MNQYKINRMFLQNQKRVYQQMDGIRNINNEQPNAQESKQLWSKIWDNEKQHERNAELRAEKDDMKQNDINITIEIIKEQVKKIPNWKSPGPDAVQGCWLKKLTALHERIPKEMDNIIS